MGKGNFNRIRINLGALSNGRVNRPWVAPVDSCEQDRERPLDYKEPKKYYSGKKKRHTFKNQLITTPDGQEIVDVIVGYPGPKSDIILWREQSKNLEETQRYNGDKAYYGEDRIKTPKKKPKNQEMPPEIK